jgi:hypothetical protein
MSVCLVGILSTAQAQSLVGSWQVVEEKTCFDAQFTESETEKELTKEMGSTANSVARVIRFNKNGTGEEAIFSTGKKKGTGKTSFKYRMTGKEIQLLDKKSGMMTQQLVIDELTATTLKIHLATKDCETKTFSKIN